MKSIFSLSCLLILFTFSCKNTLQVSKINYSNLSIDSTQNHSDTSILNMIVPYSNQLDSKMNEIIGFTAKELTKQKPESTLGNLLADATYSIAEKYSNTKPDLAIINYGGIRISSLTKGAVTLGNIYEVMPFDNYIVLLEIDGETLEKVFMLMAKNGGWPITGASYTIKNEKAINISIQGEEIIPTKTYHLAISDYLANGGDNMFMLKGLPSVSTNILLRDAFIEYFKLHLDKNIALDASLEKRVLIYE